MLDQFNSDKWFKKFKLEAFPEPEYIELKHPVLLCHGYGAFASLVKPSPLNDIAMFMRSHGVLAFAPNIVPYAKIEIRSQEWKTLIQQLSERYDIAKFNVIAHSMGGLDIRYALSKLELERYVASFTTIATPHHGTSLAELALRAPDAIQGKLGDFFDWMGDRVYPKTKSDAIGSVKQLTRSYVRERFNNEIRNLESIPYYSFSAAVGKGTSAPIETMIRFQNNHIFEEEGINDGLVSAESAEWGEHIKTVSISHLEQMSLRTDKSRIPKVKSFWLDVLKTLKKRGY
ncbi:alpha/beta hydrolase [Aliifodinibius sp. S!AR15-10]|uniref:esterase/lipase family protein n=1 Tax=Aliifodinibius sp. S!AR15-10 TaxID=2950437 RepID=UPI00286281C5|nr:alpha/beta hydrolase [Aliifodinibius sp. S!AR15-10]MDR8391754.1 alpha/beta hydrolase [Aliifodinibius sp. S!AR15-10]